MYIPKIEISFVYDGENGEDIANKFPTFFMFNYKEELITYNAGFQIVPVGVVLDQFGNIVAKDMDEFNSKYETINK